MSPSSPAEVDAGGLRIAVVHEGEPEAWRLARMRWRFPAADVVVFSRSHIPLRAVVDEGFMIVNPGSPTDRRRQPRHGMAVIEIVDGRAEVAFMAVDDPAGPLAPELVRTGRG